MNSLAVQLLGQTRSAVLTALFMHPEQAVHVRELARMTGASAGSLHRELRTLADLGLLQRREQGRQVLYQANAGHPVFGELAALLRKTSGVADVLRAAIAPLGDAVMLAFVYGSMAAGTPRSRHDCRKAFASSRQSASSKSTATKWQVSSDKRGYTPIVCSPARWS